MFGIPRSFLQDGTSRVRADREGEKILQKVFHIRGDYGNIVDMSNFTFIQHLEELRRRIIYCILSIFIASIISYSFVPRLLSFLARPIGKLVFIQPVEAFLTYIKLAIFCGFFLSLPVIIYHIWAFIGPALKPNETRYVFRFAPFSILLFLVGCLFSYFVIIPFGIRFLMGFRSPWLEPMISVGSYVSFVCIMTIVFGLVFELPLVISFLSKLGIVNRRVLRQNRRYVILVIFIVSAILTPPDVFTQIIMAIPLLVLYELSILFAK